MAIDISSLEVGKAAPSKDAAKAKAATVDASKEYGTLQDKFEFVATLGDPSRPDVNQNAKGEKVELPTPVGYRFKALVDFDKVPDFGTPEGLRKDPMAAGEITDESGNIRFRSVKAGETFDLTLCETGTFMSLEEINSRITGGSIPVSASYLSPRGTDGATTGDEGTIRVALRAISLSEDQAVKSLKAADFVDVLTFSEVTEGNRKLKKREILPGFEKWRSLAEQSRQRSGGSRVPDSSRRNDNAVKFLEFLQRKAKNA